MEIEKNRLSYWYPKLAKCVQTPKTHIIQGFSEQELYKIFDGKDSDEFDRLADLVVAKGNVVGWPCFVRTGHASGKHFWSKACYCPDPDTIKNHLAEIAEYNAMAGIMGLPLDEWVVRELLIADTVFIGPYDMPVTSEWRFFISNHKVIEKVFYWPKEAFERDCWKDRPQNWKQLLSELASQEPPIEVVQMTKTVAAVFDGDWSLDWMKTKNGWYAIDMAIAQDSWGCPNSFVG
jgi:hypothetical protein